MLQQQAEKGKKKKKKRFQKPKVTTLRTPNLATIAPPTSLVSVCVRTSVCVGVRECFAHATQGPAAIQPYSLFRRLADLAQELSSDRLAAVVAEEVVMQVHHRVVQLALALPQGRRGA